MFVATTEEMRQLDNLAINQLGIPGIVLMENAGLNVVDLIKEVLVEVKGRKVAVFTGMGNNGGDGFVIARHLMNMGAEVKILLFGEPDQVKGDARVNLDILVKMGQKVLPIHSANAVNIVKLAMVYTDLVVDAIFGTGFKGTVDNHVGRIIQLINESGKPIIAVDIPSGLEADTGKALGPAIRASHTVTFALPKIGLTVYPGREYVGKLHVADISIPPGLVVTQSLQRRLLTGDLVKKIMPQRNALDHKGTYGQVLILAGSEGMTGAAALTSMASLKAGAGLATLAVPKSLHDLMEMKLNEVMTRPLPETERRTISRDALEEVVEMSESADAIALGPGISTEPATAAFVRELLPRLSKPVVVDADGLNALAGHLEDLQEIKTNLVLTPHPGEMARLAGIKTEEVQNNRIEIAQQFATHWKITLVLKGADTLVAGADGSLYINTTGNPGMATGGSGDVLTGIIAGLIAQGLGPVEAAAAGVYLHGSAGDLGAEKRGAASLIAGDLLEYLPEILKKMEEE